jgi:hypothetical protein
MIFTLASEGRQHLVSSIRWYFAESALAESYRYSQDEEKSRIAVYDQYPEATEFLPAIIVTSIVGPGQELSVNQVGDKVYDPDTSELKGYNCQGTFVGDYSMDVQALSETSRDEIADILCFGLVRGIRQRIVEHTDANMQPDRPFFRVTSSGQRPMTDRGVLWNITIGARFIQHWYDFIELETNVGAVGATVTKT